MKKAVNKFANSISMWGKFVICFLTVLAIPVGISLFLVQSMSNTLNIQSQESVTKSAERIATRYSSVLNDIYNASLTIANNSVLLHTITHDYNSQEEQIDALMSNGNLTDYTRIAADYISEMHLYVIDKPILSTVHILNPSKEVEQEPWFQKALSGNTLPFWQVLDNSNFSNLGKKSLSLVRPVYSSNKVIGVLCIKINQEKLDDILTQENISAILVSPQDELISDTIIDNNKYDVNTLKSIHYVDNLRSENNDIIVQYPFILNDQINSFTVYSVFDKKEIFKEDLSTTISLILLIVASTAICLIFAFTLSKMITNRLQRFKDAMNKVANGDFSAHAVIDGSDEVASLSSDLNILADNINKLINEVYEINLQKQKLINEQNDIKLQMLTSQLNPHFLFNTLESIRMKAVIGQQTEIAHVMQLLSKLLRKSLYMINDPITLVEEIDLCKSYLEIQKFRFGNKLSYSINVLSNINDVYILPFSIQPLVENSIKHGFENSILDGMINVIVLTEKEKVIIKIIDNGIGIEPDKLKAIMEQLNNPTQIGNGKHIGVSNIKQRLGIYYGEKFELNISSHPGSGTIVSLTFPIDEEKNYLLK